MAKINIGIKNYDAVAKALNGYLANTYFLYLKTQSFHWNLTGELFYSLHGMFEAQYEDLQDAVDELAERVRALGVRAASSFMEFNKLAEIKEEPQSVRAMEMVTQLLADHELMARLGKDVIAIAEKEGDEATADIIVGRLEFHEKTAWMLRSTLQV